VQFENKSRDGKRLVEVQQAEVWEVRIDQQTGELHAQGPGWMKLWRRGQNPRANLGPAATVKPNGPLQLETADWEFTRVTFDGTMSGNMQQRHATFRDDVKIVYGPVHHPLAEIDRDHLPKDGGLLQCQELQVLQRVATPGEQPLMELVGQGNARLEGNSYHALADQISFDQARGTYVLRAFGKNKAKLWDQSQPGAAARETSLQRMEFNPKTRVVRIDGSAGGEGGR
jgi:hypothetical protein